MRAFFAWLLILLGALWTALTGACTAYFAAMGFTGLNPVTHPSSHGMAESWFFLSLIIGAVCMAPGIVVLIIGLILRPRRPREPAEGTFR